MREPGDDDPRITPDEVVAPALESDDAEWKAGPWYEDPDSVECGARAACEESVKAAKSSSMTSTTRGA